jgi:hypothetical protein
MGIDMELSVDSHEEKHHNLPMTIDDFEKVLAEDSAVSSRLSYIDNN